jgi:hypothetical protein
MNNDKLNTSFITSIENIWKYSLDILKEIFNLFILEVKLAGRSLAMIVIMVIIAALLLLSSWFCLLGALVSWLLTLHISLVLSLSLASAINFMIAILIGIYIAKISTHLRFKETRRQLFMKENNEAVTEGN